MMSSNLENFFLAGVCGLRAGQLAGCDRLRELLLDWPAEKTGGRNLKERCSDN
jgi:hypothetical protein